MKIFIMGKDQWGTPPRVCPFLAFLRINRREGAGDEGERRTGFGAGREYIGGISNGQQI
jgi:hypothetical protein